MIDDLGALLIRSSPFLVRWIHVTTWLEMQDVGKCGNKCLYGLTVIW